MPTTINQTELSEIQHRTNEAMTVRHLLQSFGVVPAEGTSGEILDKPVLFVCNYGDHCNTPQVLPIGDVVESSEREMRETRYSNSGIAMQEDDYGDFSERELDDVDEGDIQNVFILK